MENILGTVDLIIKDNLKMVWDMVKVTQKQILYYEYIIVENLNQNNIILLLCASKIL